MKFNKNFRGIFVAIAFIISFSLFLSADTIRLKNGDIVHGKIKKEDKEKVIIKTDSGEEKSFAISEVEQTIRGDTYKDYLKRKGECKTAEDFYKLGLWCKSKKLLPEAEAMWEEVIKLDPEHEKARKELGHIKKEGRWLTKEDQGYVKYKGKWVKKEELQKIKENEKNQRFTSAMAIDIKIGVSDNADKEWFEQYKKRVLLASRWLWEISQGGIYFKSVIIEDKCKDGDYHVVTLKGDMIKPGYYGWTVKGSGGSYIEVAGEGEPYTFTHEYMHYKFDLPDHQHATGTECLMRQGGGLKLYQFCNTCWDTLRKKWNIKPLPDVPIDKWGDVRRLMQPPPPIDKVSPDEAPLLPPELKFTIKDN